MNHHSHHQAQSEMSLNLGMHMDHGNMSMDMMKMYFNFDLNVYLFLKALYLDSTGKLVGGCVGVFILAILYEALKMFREHLYARASTELHYLLSESDYAPGSGGSSQLTPRYGSDSSSRPSSQRYLRHFVQTLLHMLQVLLAYLLMLAFMTYNGYLCIAIILGAGVGYACFGWRRSSAVNLGDHCQ